MIDKEIASLDNFKKNFSEEAYYNAEIGSPTQSILNPEDRCMCEECITFTRNNIITPQAVSYFTNPDPNVWQTALTESIYTPNPWGQGEQAYRDAVVYGTSAVTITSTTYTGTNGLPE